MKIHEYQAKDLFRAYDIPAPVGEIATTPEQAREAADRIGGGVIAVKSQVHVGGRGKAGGIRIAKSPEEVEQAAQEILGMKIKGCTVRKVLVESGAKIAKEAYLAVIIDRGRKSIGFIASAEGGVEIEEVAATTPEKILRFWTDSKNFPEMAAREVAGQLFHDESKAEVVTDVMRKLFNLFVEKDCSLAEINPLVLTESVR